MAESLPPIQKTVDPKLSMTSAEQALALEKAFDETFGPIGETNEPKPGTIPPEGGAAPGGEQDKTTETPPPEEIPPTEKGGETPGETPQAGEPADRGTGPTHPDDEPDEEVDKYKLHPETRPESLNVFRDLRGMLKTERKRLKELETKLAQTDRSPRPVNDPGVQKEIEELRQFRQQHQIFDDTTYQTQFENPVRDQFNDIINDVKAISNDPAAAQEWENQMRAAGPDRLDRKYWNEGLINQVGDPLDRDRLVRKVSTLLELQQKRNQFRTQVANEPQAYEKFQAQQAANYWDNFGREAEDEMKKVTPTLGEWASPKDLKTAKNATEKAAIEAHNAAYAGYEEAFKRYITDAATAGPRGMARVSAMAVMAEKRGKDLEAANKKITKLQAELTQAQEELNKVAGARSRIAQPSSASTNGQPPPQGKRKASQSVDDAFRQHFGN